jgi:hypothetical protein
LKYLHGQYLDDVKSDRDQHPTHAGVMHGGGSTKDQALAQDTLMTGLLQLFRSF